MDNRSKNLIKNTTILSFGTLCTKVISFILVPFITRIISTSEYGFFDLVYTYIILLVPILTLGIGDGIFRFLIDSKNEEERKKITSNGLLACVFTVIPIIIAYIINFYFDFLDNTTFFLICIFLLLEIMFDLFGKVLRGNKNITSYTISNILFVLGITIGVFLFVYLFEMGLNGMFLAYITGDIVSNMFMLMKGKIFKYIKVKSIKKETALELIKYSCPLIISGISWWIINVSDRTITTIYCGLGLTGIYAIANKIPGLIQTFYNVFQISWVENASDTINDADSAVYYNKVYNNMFYLLTFITIILLASNFIFFDYIFSAEYDTALFHAPLLILATFFNMLGTFLGGIYVARKETKKQGKTVALAAVVNLIVDFLLIKFIGLFAASISTLISYLVMFYVRKIDIGRIMKIELTKNNKYVCIFIIYFFITSYISNFILNIINFTLSIVIFIIFNYKLVLKTIKKVVKRV